MSMWPPWPWGKRIGTYEAILRHRYAKTLSAGDHLATANARLVDAIEHVASALTTLGNSAQNDALVAARQEIAAAKGAAADATAAVDSLEELAADRAAELVRNYLDLQVSKSGGLLAFNGLAVAVATILWTNSTLTVAAYLPILLFGALFVSSILSLIAILVWWERASVYGTANDELKHLIRFTAIRAWAINIATLLSIASVLLIAVWLVTAGRKVVATTSGNIRAPFAVTCGISEARELLEHIVEVAGSRTARRGLTLV